MLWLAMVSSGSEGILLVVGFLWTHSIHIHGWYSNTGQIHLGWGGMRVDGQGLVIWVPSEIGILVSSGKGRNDKRWSVAQ